MAPRKKKTGPAVESQQLDIEQAIAAVFDPAALIAEWHKLDAHVESESKRFGEYLKPSRDRMEAIKAELHAKALEQKVNGFPTNEGTAYLSTIVSHKIDPDSAYDTADGRHSVGRDALLDWMLDNWDEYGSEGMQLNISKPIVEKWREEHDNKPPPGLKLDTMVRLNIRKS
ncbi:MAG: hypothetical protein WC829_24470 [Hyphomicrobium sp.]|jgi:hypothetical protein